MNTASKFLLVTTLSALGSFLITSYINPIKNNSLYSINNVSTFQQQSRLSPQLEKEDNYTFIKNTLAKPYSSKTLLALSQHIRNINDEDEIKKLIILFSNHRQKLTAHFLYERWGELNPEKALAFLNQRTLDKNYRSYDKLINYKHSIFKAWLNIAPEKAIAYHEKNTIIDSGLHILVAKHKLSKNPTEGIEWFLSESQNKKERDNSISYNNYYDIIDQYVLSKPPEEILKSFSHINISNNLQNHILEVIAGVWAIQDWQKTKDWMNTLSEEQKKIAYSKAIEYYALKNPQAALAEITAENTTHLEDVFASIIPFLVQGDINVPADWLKKNVSREKPIGLNEIITAWSIINKEKPIKLLNHFPKSYMKAEALENLLRYGNAFSPIDKLDVMIEYQKTSGSLNNLHNPYYHLFQANIQDPEKTKTWIDKHLPPEDAKHLEGNYELQENLIHPF